MHLVDCWRAAEEFTGTERGRGLINEARLEIANKILAVMEKGMQLTVKNKRIHLRWKNYYGDYFEKPWLCRHGHHYPSIARQVPTGGTHITAISQLVSWIRDKPVYFHDTWVYWCSPTVGMKPGPEILALLLDSDYPKERKCHWCGNTEGRFDWYAFGQRHMGMGCMHRCEPLAKLIEQERSKR